MTTKTPASPSNTRSEQRRVIVASVVGTVMEWYDFFLYAALASTIGVLFFGAYPESTRNIFALLVFALGFMVRPLGALLWGHFGDRIGRQRVFLITIVVMGASTVAVGVLPTVQTIGWLAPVLLILLRVLQGLAISGEFGAAVTYVAESAPPRRRGLYTSAVPASIAGGLLLSLLVVLVTQAALGAEQFAAWGWRVPFLASIVLMVVSIVLRRRLAESPVFEEMRAQHRVSESPVREAFGTRRNLRTVLVVFFGLSMATAVLGYAGTTFSLTFLTSAVKIGSFSANIIFAIVMALGAVFCVLVSWLSDLVGRKPIIVASALLAALLYFPVYGGVVATANPGLAAARDSADIVVAADTATCSFRFNPAGVSTSLSSCDAARSTLSAASAPYRVVDAGQGAATTVSVNGTEVAAGDGFDKRLADALAGAGFGSQAERTVSIDSVSDIFARQTLALIGLLLVPVLLAQMAQGPAAAMIVELFPASIRYTALSLPYQLATGWVGGLLPAIVFAINLEAGDILAGLWYPIGLALVAFAVGTLFLPETRHRDIAA